METLTFLDEKQLLAHIMQLDQRGVISIHKSFLNDSEALFKELKHVMQIYYKNTETRNSINHLAKIIKEA